MPVVQGSSCNICRTRTKGSPRDYRMTDPSISDCRSSGVSAANSFSWKKSSWEGKDWKLMPDVSSNVVALKPEKPSITKRARLKIPFPCQVSCGLLLHVCILKLHTHAKGKRWSAIESWIKCHLRHEKPSNLCKWLGWKVTPSSRKDEPCGSVLCSSFPMCFELWNSKEPFETSAQIGEISLKRGFFRGISVAFASIFFLPIIWKPGIHPKRAWKRVFLCPDIWTLTQRYRRVVSQKLRQQTDPEKTLSRKRCALLSQRCHLPTKHSLKSFL